MLTRKKELRDRRKEEKKKSERTQNRHAQNPTALYRIPRGPTWFPFCCCPNLLSAAKPISALQHRLPGRRGV